MARANPSSYMADLELLFGLPCEPRSRRCFSSPVSGSSTSYRESRNSVFALVSWLPSPSWIAQGCLYWPLKPPWLASLTNGIESCCRGGGGGVSLLFTPFSFILCLHFDLVLIVRLGHRGARICSGHGGHGSELERERDEGLT
uniref:Uncharacterized protein n=1 Tax=Fagus sylvatica TaxID=28930 RepID=A0A2N9EX17_FAGSY